MKSTPIVPGGIPHMSIIYKYKYQKVRGLIAAEGTGSTNPGDPYLFIPPENHYNVSILTVSYLCVLVIYVNTCNVIDNHNRMWKSERWFENAYPNVTLNQDAIPFCLQCTN